MAKKWTDKEITYLKRYAATKRIEELAQRVDADEREVEAKLEELGLESRDGAGRSRLGNEPLLATYEEGLKALYDGKTKEAEKLLGKVVEECDQPELTDRAQQLLAGLRRRKAEAPAESDDPYLLAVFEKNQGNYERALEIAKAGGRTGKDERFAYLEAAIHALEQRLDEAASALGRAIEMNEKNRVHAFHDPDFRPLRSSRDHAELFQG